MSTNHGWPVRQPAANDTPQRMSYPVRHVSKIESMRKDKNSVRSRGWSRLVAGMFRGRLMLLVISLRLATRQEFESNLGRYPSWVTRSPCPYDCWLCAKQHSISRLDGAEIYFCPPSSSSTSLLSSFQPLGVKSNSTLLSVAPSFVEAREER